MPQIRNPATSAPEGKTFPPAWQWWVDEAIPEWVKKQYSPRETWKSKPFGPEDAQFFFKGIEELSELFTDERPKNIPAYFNHPKFRSSYLLYFLPLQAAKFLTIFNLHPAALQAALEHGRESGCLRIADLGAGPGTASIALLLKLLGMPLETGEELPLVEIDLLDTNPSILEDGKQLALQIASHFPRLRGKVTVRTHVAPWWEAPALLPKETSLLLMGHVMNESGGPNRAVPQQEIAWQKTWSALMSPERLRGGGMLLVETAARHSSQILAHLRDHLIETELLAPEPESIWGPCLHAGKCPLAEGRDWCHFSIPTHIPGQWFREFSKGLGSERQWVKFSYLWFAAREKPAPHPDPKIRRVISDPLGANQGGTEVLICEPVQPGRFPVSERQRLWRGDLVRLGETPGSGTRASTYDAPGETPRRFAKPGAGRSSKPTKPRRKT